jgi:hypothetical protein
VERAGLDSRWREELAAWPISLELDAGLDELRGSGFSNLDDHLGPSLLDPADPDWLAAFLEHSAGRGENPGELRRARR